MSVCVTAQAITFEPTKAGNIIFSISISLQYPGQVGVSRSLDQGQGQMTKDPNPHNSTTYLYSKVKVIERSMSFNVKATRNMFTGYECFCDLCVMWMVAFD